jgi:hypothetical protein
MPVANGTNSFLAPATPQAPLAPAINGKDQTAVEIRGLNTSFLAYITKCVKEDCFVDLSRVNLEYNSYLSKIGQKSEAPREEAIISGSLLKLPESNQKLPLSLSFGSKPAKTDTPFQSFNDPKTTETRKFEFGSTAFKATEAPKFDFTQAPKFEFTQAPKFEFATTPFKTETVTGNLNDQKPSIFSQVPTFGKSAGLAENTSTTVDGEVDDEIVHEEQVGDALMAGKAGEEGEVTLYSVRSKLRKFINGVWEVIGLGLLKVNQNQSTKVSRIIMRSEAGKVLLNVSIFSEMPVTLKDTSVNFSASLIAGSLTTLSAKVKEKQDAISLVEAIEKAKTKN